MLAAHAYFRPLNLESERTSFLEGSTELPQFTYREYVDGALGESDDRLIKAAFLVRKSPTSDHIKNFRDLNEKMYGKPSTKLARGIITNIHTKIDNPTKENLWEEVRQRLDAPMLIPDNLPVVSKEVFLCYKKYFQYYSKSYFESIDLKKMSLSDCISGAIDITGLAAEGWSLFEQAGSFHARVNHSKKRIILGRDYTPRSMNAKARIAVHEVYGHALRGKILSLRESEGFAVVLEQLLGSSLKYRRSYRYLVGVLAYRGMSFREVFEIMWRLMAIASNYPKENARTHAFNECARIFRGGIMEGKGAIFLKDTVYFEGNLKVWEVLSQQLLSYESFVDMIEGRRVAL